MTFPAHLPAHSAFTSISLGAPSLCNVISVDSELDGCEMDLSDALTKIVGRGQGTFVCCVPGELAYFEGEEHNERYILLPRTVDGIIGNRQSAPFRKVLPI